MYCQKCGNEIPDNSVFCDSCGEKVTFSPGISAKDKKKRNTTIIVLSILLAVALAGCGVLGYIAIRQANLVAFKSEVIKNKNNSIDYYENEMDLLRERAEFLGITDQSIITNMNVGFGGHASPFGFITRKQLGRMAISHVLYVAKRRFLCIAGNAEKKTETVQHFVGIVACRWIWQLKIGEAQKTTN